MRAGGTRTAAVAMVVLSVVSSACFGRGGTGGDSNDISVWMFPQGDDEVAIHGIEAAFEKANPEKNLDIVVYPEDEYQTKVNTALIAGEPPDVAIMENPEWMKVGFALDLTQYLDDWGVTLDDYNPGGLARGAAEGNPSEGLYGIGTFLGGNVIVYNKDIFDQRGVAYPPADRSLSYQEYAELCRRLARPDEDPVRNIYGCSMPDFSFSFYPIYGEDGHTAQGFMNSPELAEAFEIGAALINDGLAPSSSVLDTITEPDLFAQGKIAMTWSDFSSVPLYEESGIAFGMAPFFVVQGQEDFVDTWTAAWGTFTHSRHRDDALTLLKFLATDGQRIQMQTTADPPLATTVAHQGGYGADDPIKAQFLSVLQNARPLVFVPPGEDAWDPYEVLRLLTVEKQSDAQPILDAMATDAQAQLGAVWERWEKLDRARFEHDVQAESSASEEE